MNNTPDTSEPLAASVLFVLIFAFMGSSVLVAKHDEKVGDVTKGIVNRRQGPVSEGVRHLAPLDSLHESKQPPMPVPLLSAAPSGIEGDVSHAQLPYLKDHRVSESVVDVLRLPVLQGVLKPEQGGSKFQLGETHGLNPSNKGGKSAAHDDADKPNSERFPVVHILLFAILVLAVPAVYYVIEERQWSRDMSAFRDHMSLPIDRSRHSDGSVNVHYGRTQKIRYTKTKDR